MVVVFGLGGRGWGVIESIFLSILFAVGVPIQIGFSW